MVGRRGEVCGETGERVMIENNRNQINVQSCNAGVLCGLSEMITDFRAVRSEDKHYGNDAHYI